jgi:hypothetical protein
MEHGDIHWINGRDLERGWIFAAHAKSGSLRCPRVSTPYYVQGDGATKDISRKLQGDPPGPLLVAI